MADTKTTGLAELDAVPAVGDWLPFVDVSDTTMSASGTTKKINADRFIYTTGVANTLAANLNVNSKNLTNVGTIAIGSDFSPTYKADVLASAGSANIFRAGQVGVSNGLTIATNGTTLTYIFNNAKVGINEISPDYALHITGGTSAPFPIIKIENSVGKSWWLYAGALGANNFGLYDETAGAYRWIVDTNGNFCLGNTTPSYRFDTLAAAGSASIMRAGQSGVSNGFTITSNGTRLTYTFDPSVTVSGGTVTCVDLVETSSQEIKENLEEIPNVLDRLVGLKAYRYNRRGDPVAHKRIGLLAEQVGSVFPEVVADVTIMENDEEVVTKGINYGRMSTLSMLGLNELVGRLQTAKEFLDNKIQQGANKLTDHEQRIRALETAVAALRK